MKALFTLFFVFSKIGVMTFGGGYAMLPFLQRELVEKRNWVTESELTDYFAIGQCTPGVIAVNTATFIGYKKNGTLGSVFATLGLVFPSLIIITIIAAFINNFSDLPLVQDALAGIRAAVCALILSAVIKLWKNSVTSKFGITLFTVVFLAAVFTNLSAAFLIIISGILGLVFDSVQRRHKV